MFVKFGQIASTRGDLLVQPVIEELFLLRSSVRPIPSGRSVSWSRTSSAGRSRRSLPPSSSSRWPRPPIGPAHQGGHRDRSSVVVKLQRLPARRPSSAATPPFYDVAGRIEPTTMTGPRTSRASGKLTKLIAAWTTSSTPTTATMYPKPLHRPWPRPELPHDDVVRVPLVFHSLCTRQAARHKGGARPAHRRRTITATGRRGLLAAPPVQLPGPGCRPGHRLPRPSRIQET